MDCTVGTWDFELSTGLLAVHAGGETAARLGLPGDPVRAADVGSRLHPDDAEGLAAAVGAMDDGRPALRRVVRIAGGADGWIWIEVTGRRSADGRWLSGIWADVTGDRKALARKDEAVARVHQFAAAASHDLIGPLRHIAMYGDLLIGDFGAAATPEQRQMLQAIADKARSLQVLTKRLIAFSTDASTPVFVAVPLDRALGNVRERLSAEIAASGASVAAEALPAVAGDPLLIEKVFENLLRNALEWSPGRQPEITVAARDDGHAVTVTVADKGCGIDPRYATRIFDAFWSLPRPGGVKGAGLGLAACKTILSALGGDVALLSSSPAGTAFAVVLPSAR